MDLKNLMGEWAINKWCGGYRLRAFNGNQASQNNAVFLIINNNFKFN